MSEDLAPEIAAHYAAGREASRLDQGPGLLERARTQELLARYLPPAPATVLDVGGGPGTYACWLAGLGYQVHLVDPVPLHVEQARAASARQPACPLASAGLGDARRLETATASADAVLLLGPLYHLTERSERLRALREAARVLKPGGLLAAAAVGRFASLLDGLVEGFLDDPAFVAIVERDLQDGQHRNPTPRDYFTTAFFHLPGELADELVASGFAVEAVLGVEGPGWLLRDLTERWRRPEQRRRLLEAARTVEREPSLLGLSPHLLAIAHAPGA